MGKHLGWLAALLLTLAACAVPAAQDGKVYIRSEPSGAEIWLVTGKTNKGEDLLRRLGKKTNALVRVPQGRQTFVLKMESYKATRVEVEIKGTGIIKPGVTKLARETRNVDVIYEHGDGWQVFVDGKPVRDIEGKIATTPCTIPLPSGAKHISIAKKGFVDQKIPIETGGTIKFRRKSWKGASKLLLMHLDVATKNHHEVLARIIVKENMGCKIDTLKKGISSHTNINRPFLSIPKEINGKKFTQVVAGINSSMEVSFFSTGSIYILVIPGFSGSSAVINYLSRKNGKLMPFTASTNGGIFKIWKITKHKGEKIVVPAQAILVASDLRKL